MKNLNLLTIICLLPFLSSCNVMLRLSDPFIPNKLDAKISLLEKIQAEPDSLFVYIGNSEFYDEEFRKFIDTNNIFYKQVIESIKENNNLDYDIVTIGPELWDDDEYGYVMCHNVMLIHINTCYGLRIEYYRKGFKWIIMTITFIIPERICMPRISNQLE